MKRKFVEEEGEEEKEKKKQFGVSAPSLVALPAGMFMQSSNPSPLTYLLTSDFL